MAKKKANPSAAAEKQAAAQSPGLIICRSKNWRHISAYHGSWLQLPIELLESLAHQNWTMPSPRLIDPAVFFDLLKIRKYVDEAAHDSVRASSGISNNAMSGRMDYFGTGGGPASQLSKERIFKIRQKAVVLLSKAFALDEIAASVATMQATSTIEDVGHLVLKREPSNNTAKYVHFFHEKVPSRSMAQHTTVQTLTDIISTSPWEEQAAPLRTRGVTHMFKEQYEDAAADFTLALRIVEELKKIHKPNQQELELASRMRAQSEAWQKGHKDWRSIPQLKEEDQPRSLEMQLLFDRAGVYLVMACESIHDSLDCLKEYQAAEQRGETTDADNAAHSVRLEARKRVKTNAKRALKDYMAFLSHFEYTPGLPYETTNEIMRRIYDLARGKRTATASPMERLMDLEASDTEIANDSTALMKSQKTKRESFERSEDGWPKFPLPRIYPASMLFAERPLQDLPLYPDEEAEAHPSSGLLKEALGSREVVTYHPLLTEALHSLLLAHTLLQTSTTEHQRHAYNVARLTRIADGYPLFHSTRSPAKADWQEILVDTKNWLGISTSWQTLCTPVPLPDAAGGWTLRKSHKRREACHRKFASEDAEQLRERIKHESIVDALSDDRVVDQESFQKSVQARQARATCREEAAASEDGVDPHVWKKIMSVPYKKPDACLKDAVKDLDATEGDANSLCSSRAQAIVRWIVEAPLSMGTKKKRPARRKKPTEHSNGASALTESVSTLSVEDDVD